MSAIAKPAVQDAKAATPDWVTLLAPAHLRWSSALSVSLFLFCLQLALSLLMPRREWVTAVSLMLQYALAAAVAWRARRGLSRVLRWKWILLSLSLAGIALNDVVNLYGLYVLKFDPATAWLSDLVYNLRLLPLFLALCRPDDETEPNSSAWLDLGQLVLISIGFVVLLFPGLALLGVRPEQHVTPVDEHLIDQIIYVVLAVVCCTSIFGVLAARSREGLRFSISAILFTLPFAAIVLFLNNVVVERWHSAPSSPWFLLGALPAMLFLLWQKSPATLSATKPPLRRFALIFQVGGPMLLTFAAILLGGSIGLAGYHPVLASALALSSFALYAGRTTMAQANHVLREHRLLASNADLEEISNRDELTGLNNRRWLTQALRAQWRIAQRAGHNFSLLLIDVDFFKPFNDTRGHAAGDSCLVAVAHELKRIIDRQADSVSRYGGEEFVVLLPNTGPAGAFIVAERLRKAISDLQVPHPASSLGHVTISIGVASRVGEWDRDPPETLLDLADGALYRAKHRGRNRVEAVIHGTAARADSGEHAMAAPQR